MKSKEWENMQIGRRKPKIGNIYAEEFRDQSSIQQETPRKRDYVDSNEVDFPRVTCKIANRRMASRGSYARSHCPRSTLHFGLVAEKPPE